MSPEENKAQLLEFWEEVWNKRNADLAPEYVGLDALPFILQFYGVFTNFSSDLSVQVTDVAAEGDRVAACVMFSGTHDGMLAMPGMTIPATGKKAQIRMVGFWQYRDGKIERFWGEWDKPGLLRQLGAMPGPPAASASQG